MTASQPSPLEGSKASKSSVRAVGHGTDRSHGDERISLRDDSPAQPLERAAQEATNLRRGRLMTAGTYELTVGELAVLLATSMAYPLNMQNPAPGSEELLARVWTDLAAAKPGAAQKAFEFGKSSNAHPTTVVTLATVLTESSNP